MNKKKISMFVILSLSIAIVVMGTTGMSLVSPVFAGGDHHDHDGKKCKDNGDDSCNDTHKTQKNKGKNDCKADIEIKHSEQASIATSVNCEDINTNVKVKDIDQTNSTLDILGDPFF